MFFLNLKKLFSFFKIKKSLLKTIVTQESNHFFFNVFYKSFQKKNTL